MTEAVASERMQVSLTDPRLQRVAEVAGLALMFYFVQQLFWPAPMGVIVQGMVIGGLTALIAFGIALIYRANRIINFAQGDLGGAPASLSVLLIVGSGFPYFVALPLGMLAAVALGGIVEFLIIRRFFNAPRLILTVATLFLSQLLIGLSLVLPRLFDITTPPQSFPSPFNFSFEIHPIIFRGNDVIAMLAIPVVIAALMAFFRYTHIGIAVRASAESADRALLLGVPVKRIQTVVWVLATLLASTAIFLRAGIVGLPIGRVLGPAILVRALAACVIGRMERFGAIFVGAVGLGIIEQAIVWHTGRSIVTAPILFLVVLGALLFQRRGVVARSDEASSWRSIKDVRPVPRELRHLPEVRWGLKVPAAVVTLFLLTLPVWADQAKINLAAVVLIFAIIGISLVVLTGWAGQVSLGQMAFVGIGAAVGGSLTTKLGWDFGVAIVVGGLAGALAAIVIGLPALRIRGLFLAVTTLAFALATSSFLLNREFFGSWLPLDRVHRQPLFGFISIDSETRYFYFTMVALGLALAMTRSFRNSRSGRILIGIRENERGAQVFGVNATAAKLTAFAVSGFLAAAAGVIFIHHQRALGVSSFEPEQSLAVFAMVVVGGLASLPGAVLGAAYLVGLGYFLPGLRFLAGGVGGLLVLMLLPGGLGSLLYQVRDSYLRWVAERRKILVPSLVADAREGYEAVAKPKGFDFAAAAFPGQGEAVPPEPAVAGQAAEAAQAGERAEAGERA